MMRFLLRLLGVVGLFAAGLGGLGLLAMPREEYHGPAFSTWLAVTISGGAVALVVLVVEMATGMRQAAGRRSAAGSMVLLQVALATALLVGVNVFSVFHYQRWDTTREKEFSRTKTGKAGSDLAAQLQNLRGETTVIIYQRHKTFGRFS
ncbi:MAG TPA: hypothetical protein VGZ47_23000, partial [Gemmataceae bacterium]|nr:hypothetical protein [Gemmataceae bacterium]